MKKVLTAVIGAAFILILSCGITANAEEYKLTLLQEGGLSHPYRSEYEPEELRDEIESALYDKSESVDVSAPQISSEELSKVYEDVINHAPKLYYVLGDVRIEQSETGYTIYPSYKESIELASSSEREIIQKAVDDILAQVKPGMSDVEKILAVHDYIVLNYEYDYNYDIYSAEEFFVNKRGVCQSYTLAMKWIMDDLGIDSEYAESDLMDHIWNIVRLNGRWYHIDATWDDPALIRTLSNGDQGSGDVYGRVYHSYFLLSDEAISDNAHEHYGWVTVDEYWDDLNITANSTLYDEYFWTNIDEPMQYYNGKWYWCTDYGSDVMQAGINCCRMSDTCIENIINAYNIFKMDIYNNYFYFRCSDRIYMSPVSKPEEAVPIIQIDSYDNLNGSHIENGYFFYAIASDEYYMRSDGEYSIGEATYTDYYRYRTINSIDLRGYRYNNIAPSWRFDEESGTLIVSSGSGVIPDYGSFYPPWKSYSDAVKKIYIGKSVKQIEANAFSNMCNAEDIILPDDLEEIGERAFYGCRGIKTLTIPDSVTSIGSDAFYNCGSLSVLFMGNGIKDIGESAFGNCRNLAEVYYSGSERDLAAVNIGDWNTYLTNAQIICDYIPPMMMHIFDDNGNMVVLWLNDNKTLVGQEFDCSIKKYSNGRVYDYTDAECVCDSRIVRFQNGVFSGIKVGQTPVTMRIGEDEEVFDLYVGEKKNIRMLAYFGYGVTPIAASYGAEGELVECRLLDPGTINNTGINYTNYGGENKLMAWENINDSMRPAGPPISLSDLILMSEDERVLNFSGSEE